MFDNVCKFLAESYSSDFATWLLGEPITLTELAPSELLLEPIRADSLILLQSDELVMHIEFQTEPKKRVPFRMTDYRLRNHRKFPEKRMYQVVIYLQPTKSELVQQNCFVLENTIHYYNVIRLWEQDSNIFLNTPGLLPFAPLSKTSDKTQTLQQVAEAIEQITDSTTQSNIAASTAVLAGLVLDKELITRLLRSDLMRESVIYQDIQEEKALDIAIKMINEGIADEVIARVTGLTVEKIRNLHSEQSKKP
ncbi:hypothetical protein CAL7716_095910 [Calothrix sp. PCC 7716]|nr:hypothetical protein CAL7716_095910 [Calothrix sp. PCC 7716]